jgi:hypothetical protein
MAQAASTLQERISRLDRKLTAKQIEELSSLVGLLGFRLTPISAPKVKKPSKWEARFRARAYKGISCTISAKASRPGTRADFARPIGLPTFPSGTPMPALGAIGTAAIGKC